MKGRKADSTRIRRASGSGFQTHDNEGRNVFSKSVERGLGDIVEGLTSIPVLFLSKHAVLLRVPVWKRAQTPVSYEGKVQGEGFPE